jgi:hypothetical protein
MADEKYVVQTDHSTYRDLTRGEVERLIRDRKVKPSDRYRNVVTGEEGRLGEHPYFSKFAAGKSDSSDRRSQAPWYAVCAAVSLLVGAAIGVAIWSSLGENTEQPDVQEKQKAQPAEPTPECEKRHATCSINGVEGRCVRGGWCMPAGPGCIHDVDCRDGNPCTDARCQKGSCVLESTAAECKTEGGEQGMCRRGICEPELPDTCVDDSDCPEFENACLSVRCGSEGQCNVEQADDGDSCTTSTDAPGTCQEGACQVDEELASKRRDIDCKTVRGYYGQTFKRCDKSLLFRLDQEKREGARKDIRERIQDQMRYDVFVSLIELPNGGYNILTTNLRSRDKVQGLVDPSFVAFTMAGYTKGTGWRSRQLQVWIRPYEEGWAIPTSGSRVAMEKGRANSLLGSLGVVDVKKYRSWLQKNFYKLNSPSAFEGDGKSAGE